MNDYDDEYYIVERDHEKNGIYLKPLRKTVKRKYNYSIVPPGGEPFFFQQVLDDERDIYSDDFNKFPSVLMDGNNLLVTADLYDQIKWVKGVHLQFYPSVIIDSEKKWHEGYYYLNFFDTLDCWDRKNSVYPKKGESNLDDPFIKKISLDPSVLDPLPFDERAMFRLGNSLHAFVLFHEKVVNKLLSSGAFGVNFYKNSTFVFGDHYKA